MKFTPNTQRQFCRAIEDALEFLIDDENEMLNPCIYAETGGVDRREIGFCFGAKEHMQPGDILWKMVEPHSFGDYDPTADLEDEANGICDKAWVDVVNDISANF